MRRCRVDPADIALNRAVESLRRTGLLRKSGYGRALSWHLTDAGELRVLHILQRDLGSEWFHRFHTTETTDFVESHKMLLDGLDELLGKLRPYTPEHVLLYTTREAMKTIKQVCA